MGIWLVPVVFISIGLSTRWLEPRWSRARAVVSCRRDAGRLSACSVRLPFAGEFPEPEMAISIVSSSFRGPDKSFAVQAKAPLS
jgi:hypothetical protein